MRVEEGREEPMVQNTRSRRIIKPSAPSKLNFNRYYILHAYYALGTFVQDSYDNLLVSYENFK